MAVSQEPEELVPRADRPGSAEAGRATDPCTMVIFGASGDLAGRELVPSLLELESKRLLPEPFAVLGVAISDWGEEEYRRRMEERCREECDFDRQAWDRLASRLFYEAGDLTDGGSYDGFEGRLEALRRDRDLPGNAFFHLATPPELFGPVAEHLGEQGLARSDDGWRRLVVEKPFGEDRASARDLDQRLRQVFDEDQIFRIDHFLGKETVQNMLVFRFANPAFEPIWNRAYIDHVEITAAEPIGVAGRGRFYEETGAVRDMIQNHLLQLLCLTAIGPPVAFDGDALRDETVKVLRSIRPPDTSRVVRGQYGPGVVDGEEVKGYREEDHVDPESTTETYAALRLELDSWRWAGVPFFLRTGKRMARKLTEVAVHFKPTPHLMFPLDGDGPTMRNVLAFRLQPQEGILQTFVAKRPGPEVELVPVTSKFLYSQAFGVSEPPRAYGWLILDVMEGDQTLFARADWIDLAWSIVDPVAARFQDEEPRGFPNYDAGSWGPEAADELIAADGCSWRTREEKGAGA